MRLLHKPLALIARHGPLITVLLLLSAALLYLFFESLRLNDNRFVYALDDAYIHLAVARNFAEYGVWGLTRFNFESPVSSIAWPLLLALLHPFVTPEQFVFLPFILNLILAFVALYIVYNALRRVRVPAPWITLALCVIAFGTPLPALIFSGMEHTLHLVLMLLLLLQCSRILQAEKDRHTLGRDEFWLLLITMLLTMTRYEGLFAILVCAVLIILRGRWAFAALIIGMAALPLLVYGGLSVLQGAHILPNSLYIKANLNESLSLQSLIQRLGIQPIYANLLRMPDFLAFTMLISLLTLAVTYYRRFTPSNPENNPQRWTQPTTIALIWLGTMILHLQYAAIGWFMRYEAYLIGSAVFVCMMLAQPLLLRLQWRSWRLRDGLQAEHLLWLLVWLLPLAFAYNGLASRLTYTMNATPRATNDIYRYHYQLALFVHRYYPDATIAANDIGALSYYNRGDVVDLYGLGDATITRAIRQHRYDAAFVDRYTAQRQVDFVVVNPAWLDYRTPDEWIPVANWVFTQKTVIPHHTLTFYAFDYDSAYILSQYLRIFARAMPDGIQVQFLSLVVNWHNE